jgi:ubiquinone/menaquinone biosynthesis C-methylase UbiE
MHSNVNNLQKIDAAYADCVYFFGLIEHVIDVSSFLAEIMRVLKKEGVVIGITPNKNSPWYKIRHFIRQTGKHCTTDKYYSIKELNKLFLSNGFTKVYASYWGAVPAGTNDYVGRFLSTIEPLLEKTYLRTLLGGLTFSYRK